MQLPKPKFTWKTVIFPLVGLIGFFLYIYLYKVDIIGILATAKKADPLIYSIAILFGLFQVLFFTVSWRVLTNHLSIKMSLSRAYLYVWYGMYVDTIVPAQSISGEVTRTYLLTRDGCGSFGKVVASLYTHRFLGTAINVVALIAGLVLLTFGGNVNPLVFNSIIIVAVAITTMLVLMAVFSLKQEWTLKGVNWATEVAHKISRGRIKLEKLKGEAIEITTHFHDSMKEFRQAPRAVAFSLSFLLVSWFFSLSIPFLVFLSLDHPVSISIIIVTSAIFLAVKSIPVGIPFEVGLPEAVMTTLYISMGVPGPLAATATILTRIITLWLFFIIGFGAQQWLELKPALTTAANTEKIKINPPA
jgi:glycosyltransferase 2 family protein